MVHPPDLAAPFVEELPRALLHREILVPVEEGDGGGEEAKPVPVRVKKLPGRNDPCYCGSGKKYKKCHYKADHGGAVASKGKEE